MEIGSPSGQTDLGRDSGSERLLSDSTGHCELSTVLCAAFTAPLSTGFGDTPTLKRGVTWVRARCLSAGVGQPNQSLSWGLGAEASAPKW